MSRKIHLADDELSILEALSKVLGAEDLKQLTTSYPRRGSETN
jgi:hypothetical protein